MHYNLSFCTVQTFSVDSVQVEWLPWRGRGLDFDAPEISPTRFRGVLRIVDIAEAYHPDRVLRQFGLAQGVPEPPIEPVYILRKDELRAYVVIHSAEQLDRWDADPRPLIELQGPQAQHGWDYSDATSTS